MREFWNSLGRSARLGVVAGTTLILATAVGAGIWLFRTDYQVLFNDLKPQDAAAMAAELERMKIPYKVGTDGSSLLVEDGAVHTTRLKLMGRDIPLHGTAGFELFNSGDFGMTEFAQKINYQRALQGEITRTILSLAEVRDARVHLALPEEGLFKRSNSKAKAAITLAFKAGQTLRPEQVAGIQRLVAAAVPGIAPADVTIVDQQGVALTRPAGSEPGAEVGSARLDLKRETEQLLARKASDVLERALGAGQAIASVDVTLNMDQVRVTTEDILGVPARGGQGTAGVIVKEREVVRDTGPTTENRPETRAPQSQRDVEYQAGRRVEQVVSQPGAIRRLQVVAVVRRPVETAQLDQIRALVSAAVGAVADRGDTVVVQSLKAFETNAPAREEFADDRAAPAGIAPAVARSPEPSAPMRWFWIGLAGCAAGFVAAWALASRRRNESTPPLTPEQRDVMLQRLQGWLDAESAPQRGAAGR